MKPFRLKVRVCNNRLIRAREELGLHQSAAAEAIGVSASQLGALENLKEAAWSDREGRWRVPAIRIAEFYGMSPEFLWPDEIAAVRKAAFQLEMAAADIPRLMPPDEAVEHKQLVAYVSEAKKFLRPVDKKALRNVEDDDATLSSIGATVDLSCERIRGLRQRGLSELRRMLDGVERRKDDAATKQVIGAWRSGHA